MLAVVIALNGFIAGLAAGDVAAATFHVGGKRGFKTIPGALKRARSGDVVVIKPGIYPGGFKVIRNVAIKAEPGAYITLGPEQIITVKGVSKVELIGLNISSTAKADAKGHVTLLEIIASRKVAVRNCYISASGGWGATIKDSRDISMENCHISGTGEVGISLEGERILLRKTTVTGFEFGVVVKAGKGIVLVSNLIDANNIGVLVAGGKVDVLGNTINGPGFAGIDIRGGDVVITGNAVRRNQHGILARAAGRGIIKRNVLGQNSSNGLFVGGPKYTVSLNTISYNAGNGIFLSPVGKWSTGVRAKVLQNVVSSNKGSGIVVTGGSEVSVRQNLLENNYNGIRVGKGVAEIARNTIVLNTGSGVRMTSGAETKLQKNIIANNQIGIYAYADAKIKSDNNVIYGHIWGQGFQLFGANYMKQGWLPTLSGDEVLLNVAPARDLRAPSDLAVDPGFVKLGRDYRLRLNSDLLKRFKTTSLPGAFPVVGSDSEPSSK